EGASVTLEEIKPTESQKEKLAKEATVIETKPEAAVAAATKDTKAPAPAAAAAKDAKVANKPAANGKTEEKKKGTFRRILKKIFS
ncbi:hypothetical protein G210_5010, partial [Candida maltosa Xu316]